MFTLKLTIYKKKACIYLVGGTKEAILTLYKTESLVEIFTYLTFTLNSHFWDGYGGFYHKGKFYSMSDSWETAKLIEKLIKES